uniref:Putative ovule protein n=1 Tax=Solanum chacoense TaxID=4108 RepID=A0A0V0GJ44_SOLCH
MTARKTKASTRETHPPCGTLVNAEDRYTPSMNQKNRRKQVARTMFLCHTKIMTSVVRNVVINILVMQARPYAFPIKIVSWNPTATESVRIIRIQFISGI